MKRTVFAAVAVVAIAAATMVWWQTGAAAGGADPKQPSVAERLNNLEKELAEAKQELARSQPPVGSIIGWHRDMKGDKEPLSLPDGWVPCDGQEITVGDLKGKKAPALNPPPSGYEGGRFLRGGTKSGVEQNATALFSKWEGDVGTAVPGDDNQFAVNSDGTQSHKRYFDKVKGDGTPEATELPFHAVRPVNMSVVWIMRVR